MVRRARAVPASGSCPSLEQGARSRLRREPPPARRVLRRGGRPHAPALARRAAPRRRALVQQPERPLRRAAARARVRRAGLRDRQAREPVRRGRRATIEEAFAKALACDPSRRSAAWSSLNRRSTRRSARRLAEQFVEVLFAPGFDDDALGRSPQAGVRILDDASGGARPASATSSACSAACSSRTPTRRRGPRRDGRRLRRADEGSGATCCSPGGCASTCLERDRDREGLPTIGIGAGQMSRVDAVRIAVAKAREHGHSLDGAVLASDAFFPFADGPGSRSRRVSTAIIQPGGSKRDAEVVAAVERAEAAMVFTSSSASRPAAVHAERIHARPLRARGRGLRRPRPARADPALPRGRPRTARRRRCLRTRHRRRDRGQSQPCGPGGPPRRARLGRLGAAAGASIGSRATSRRTSCGASSTSVSATARSSRSRGTTS